MAENTFFNQDSEDPIQAELSLHSVGQLPIEAATPHSDYPYSLTSANGVPGRRATGDCCEEVRAELRSQIELHKSNMEACIKELSSEIKHRDLEVERARFERDKALDQIDTLQARLNLEQWEKKLENTKHAQELKECNEEILRLKTCKKELEDKVLMLTQENERLNEQVQELTHDVHTLERKLENMENHRESVDQDLKEMKDALATQAAHQDALKADFDKALKESQEQLANTVATLLAGLNIDNRGHNEQGLPLCGLVQSTFSKLSVSKRVPSKSSLSSNSSNPPSSHSTPPLNASPPSQTVPVPSPGDVTPPSDTSN